MSEEEKIFSGRLFDARLPELKEIKLRSHNLCRRYNTLEETDCERNEIIDSLLGGHREKFYFQGPIQFNYGTHTFIGENFFANFNLMVMDDGRIYIGDNVMIGPNVSLLCTEHPLIADERVRMKYPDGHVSMSEIAHEIHIGDDVWIGANVSVLDDVTIGKGCVIGAGSVVTKDMPSGYVCCGVPCRPVRKITEADSLEHLL